MTGPTGVGKSSFAVALAGRIGGEIAGADAFQIYAGLPVLTAQPDSSQRAAVSHHLVGFLDLRENFDAARFVRAARDVIADIQSRGKIPILAGGTGLYLKALTHGLAEMPPVDPALRERISKLGLPRAIEELRAADPAAPLQIDLRNPVRVRRALEIVLQTGRPLAESRGQWSRPNPEFRGLVLTRDRDELRARIEANVESMLAGGAVEEVRRAAHAGAGSRRAIGFREIVDLLAGRISESECREAIATATWQYAKRQLTWCRTQFDFPSLDLSAFSSPDDAVEKALVLLAEQG